VGINETEGFKNFKIKQRKIMKTKELNEKLELHKMYLLGEKGGLKLNLSRADLRGADLSRADLREANLSRADLRGADLSRADLSGAYLSGVYLSRADLRGANLRGVNLRGVNLRGAKYNSTTSFFALQCPEEGDFIGWKKCENNIIVKLLITGNRSSATSRKCRCSAATVLDVIGQKIGVSTYDSTFTYKKGKTVSVNDFDENRWNECSTGIHFFITKQEAIDY